MPMVQVFAERRNRKRPTMTNDTFNPRRQDWIALLLVPAGVTIVMAAGFALILAGVHTADSFSPATVGNDLDRDRGIAAATAMWAAPLALVGITTAFAGIAFALARVRHNIRGRRDALVAALPRILSTNH